MADASETAAAASLNRQFGRLMADTAHVSQVVAEYDRLHFTGERMAVGAELQTCYRVHSV